MTAWWTSVVKMKGSSEAPFDKRMARAHTRAMAELIDGAKEDMRDEVLAAGLGFRLANTIRGKPFPADGRESMEPAGIVFASPGKPGGRGGAAAILRRYELGNPITPALGEALAMPTDRVPRTGRGGNRPMSPVEIEGTFGRRLQRVKLKSGNIGLFMRTGVGKRELMFVVVRQVPGDQRTELGAIFSHWASRFGELAVANFDAEGD